MSDKHVSFVEAARRSGVQDPRVLHALDAVDRNDFVPRGARLEARIDAPVRIPCGQTTSQPSLVALMLQALHLTGLERVLEVGTGLGFEAALLGQLAAQVWTVECFVDLAAQARDNLARADATNVEVVLGDGALGLPQHAPFDAIVVACASPRVAPAWTEQLVEGGRLVVPLGPGGAEEVRVFVKSGNDLGTGRLLTPARFVPLLTPTDSTRWERSCAVPTAPRDAR